MKIYFAGSITGGRGDQEIYAGILEKLQKYGTVLTTHVGNAQLTDQGETQITPAQVFRRDMDWINECDMLVAEVSTPSLGVGYEIAYAQSIGTPVVCVYRETEGKRLSSIISGNTGLTVYEYRTVEDLPRIFSIHFEGK